MKPTWLSCAGVALTVLLAGCSAGSSADEEQLAADGTEAMTSSTQSTHLGNVVFESLSEIDPDKAAAQVAGNPTALYPTGCVSRAKDPTNPRVAHVTFTDCTGPFGLVHLSGEEVVTFSAGPGGALHADIAGVDLTANDKPITFSATADITIDGAARNVKWQGTWTHVNDHGVTVSHTSDLRIDVDTAAGCATSNGNAKTTVASREVDTTVSDYEVCRNSDGALSCPSGTVTHTGKLSGKVVTVTFDGTDTAAVSGPRGNSFDVPLVCPAAER